MARQESEMEQLAVERLLSRPVKGLDYLFG